MLFSKSLDKCHQIYNFAVPGDKYELTQRSRSWPD